MVATTVAGGGPYVVVFAGFFRANRRPNKALNLTKRGFLGGRPPGAGFINARFAG
jgi:hypothetical protein